MWFILTFGKWFLHLYGSLGSSTGNLLFLSLTHSQTFLLSNQPRHISHTLCYPYHLSIISLLIFFLNIPLNFYSIHKAHPYLQPVNLPIGLLNVNSTVLHTSFHVFFSPQHFSFAFLMSWPDSLFMPLCILSFKPLLYCLLLIDMLSILISETRSMLHFQM